jgi:AAA+ superfamily predicted ATPase
MNLLKKLFSWLGKKEPSAEPPDQPVPQPDDDLFEDEPGSSETEVEQPVQDGQDAREPAANPEAEEVEDGETFHLPKRGYASSAEHMSDELRRIDLLVRAQVVRWQHLLAAHKPEDLWGMINVSHAEVEQYLHSPAYRLWQMPGELRKHLEPYWQAADRIARAIHVRLELTDDPGKLRLVQLARRFQLNYVLRDILLVCLLPEVDGRFRRLFGYLQDDASRSQPTGELVLQMLEMGNSRGEALRLAFTPDSPLVRERLLVMGGEARADDGLSMRSLRLDDRIAAFLLEAGWMDARLEGVLTVHAPDVTDPLIDEDERLDQLAEWWETQRFRPGTRGGVAFLRGPYGSGRLALAQAVCDVTQTPLLVADVRAGLAAVSLGWGALVQLCYREARLHGAAIYWAGCEALLDRDAAPRDARPLHDLPPLTWDQLTAAAESYPGLTFLASDTAWDPIGRFREQPFLHLDFHPPNYEQRRQIWMSCLEDELRRAAQPEGVPDSGFIGDLDGLAKDLANDFQFTAGQIRDAIVTARGEAALRGGPGAHPNRADLYEGCRRQSARQMTGFSRRIKPRPRANFDDLILPQANKKQLYELRDRIEYRGKVYNRLGFERHLSLGKGLIALFTGTSGTGKTLAAEMLAAQRGVDLYKVDLSAVVSKWVGETEKHLARLFLEAENANAILFFDEADALFGKRGEVKEAQDRWANMEVNYMLQRVEEYAGTVILASNLKQNMDEAFMRRIHVIVEFPFPDTEARCQIYRVTFPDTVIRPPVAELRELAERFRVTGGSIKNIVLEATFRAEAEACRDDSGRTRVTLRHLVLSIAREYQKLGKPLTRGEFGAEYYAWVARDILLENEAQVNHA